MDIPEHLIEPAKPDDAPSWLAMRRRLWPEDDEDSHRQEIEQYFVGEFPRWPWRALIAKDEAGNGLGFAEVSVRTYAQGCEGTRVAYLEGWFVEASARRAGVGRALVEAAQEWGRKQGCSEFASDADSENHVSHAAHRAVGFGDVGLVRCFRKEL